MRRLTKAQAMAAERFGNDKCIELWRDWAGGGDGGLLASKKLGCHYKTACAAICAGRFLSSKGVKK
jgi:hypothetical protein